MPFKGESAFNLFTRLRQNEYLSNDKIINGKIVTLIDLHKSDLIAANHFIYKICKLILQSFDDSNKCEDKSTLLEKDGNVFNDPLILIFDEIKAFNVIKFSEILTKVELLNYINICNEYNKEGILAVYRDLRRNLVFNKNLKLIIIYANSNVEELFNFLFDCPLKITVIIIIERITKKQLNLCLSRSYQLLNCNVIGPGKVIFKTNTTKVVGFIKHKIGLEYE